MVQTHSKPGDDGLSWTNEGRGTTTPVPIILFLEWSNCVKQLGDDPKTNPAFKLTVIPYLSYWLSSLPELIYILSQSPIQCHLHYQPSCPIISFIPYSHLNVLRHASPSSSTTSSPIHRHTFTALLELIEIKISRQVIGMSSYSQRLCSISDFSLSIPLRLRCWLCSRDSRL